MIQLVQLLVCNTQWIFKMHNATIKIHNLVVSWNSYMVQLQKRYFMIITVENSYFSDSCLKPNTQLVMWLEALCLNMIPTQTTSHGFCDLCIYSVMDGTKDDIL
jgi:hypothetical protein